MTPSANGVTPNDSLTPSKAGRSLVAAVLLAVLGGALLAGCGQTASPGQTVPALDKGLDRVDASISAGHLGQARAAVNGLIETTRQARRAGDLSAGDANRILAAAQELIAQLPREASTPQPSPTPSPQPSPTPSPQPTTPPPHEDHGTHGKHGDNGNGHKKHEGKGHSGKGEND